MNHTTEANSLSTKDLILGIAFAFSSLLAFALTFSLFRSDGRPVLFGTCVLICAICLLVIERKKEIVLASVLFIAIRVVWSLSIAAVQYLGGGHH